MNHRQDPISFEAAWQELGQSYPAGSWFRDTHLAENKGRIRRIVTDLVQLLPAEPGARVIDIGCFNGFLCHLLSLHGYPTAGIDALPDKDVPERAALMARLGAPFHFANFNEPEPFPDCPTGTFAAAILGEVFEHILYHPLGLLTKIRELLKPGGYLILTTPNPYTLANALRLLRGQGFIWGDTDFATMPKLDPRGRLISYECIHYREYHQDLLVSLMTQAGFDVVKRAYLAATTHPKQPWTARLLKASPLWNWLEGTRLFGSGNYVIGRRRD